MLIQLSASVFHVVLVGLLFFGALIKAADLRGSTPPGRKFIALLALSLLAFALGQILSFPVMSNTFDAVTAAGAGKLVHNMLIVVGLCSLYSFCIGTGMPSMHLRRSLLQIWCLGAGVIAALAILTILSPAEYRGHSLTSPHLDRPTVFSFYAVGGMFFVYVFARCGICIRQKGSRARGALSTSLNTLALGLAILVVASTVRLVRVAAVVLSGEALLMLNTATFWLNNLGYIIVTVGLSVAGFSRAVAASRWRRHRRHQYRSLTPLWSALTEEFPEISLSSISCKPRRFQWYTPFRHRFQRRVIEIQDGLLRLSSRTSQPLGVDIQKRDPALIAAEVHRALAQPQAENPFHFKRTSCEDSGGQTSPEEVVEALASISREFSRSGAVGSP